MNHATSRMDELRAAFRASGLTQVELAALVGMTQGTVSRSLSAKDLRLSTWAKLMDACRGCACK